MKRIFLSVILPVLACLFVMNCDNGSASSPAVNISAIEGITMLAAATPVSAITSTDQFTGTVSWEPALFNGRFEGGKAYTATITLTPINGYIFQGVTQNFFKVEGASSSNNPANSGTVTAVFSAHSYPAPDKFVALTFDDGPSTSTIPVMDVLKALDVKATMFLLGVNLENPAHQARVGRMVADGHEFANHAYNHNQWGSGGYTKAEMKENFQKNQILIKEKTGADVKFFRFPYYDRSHEGLQVLAEMGLPDINSGNDPNDWNSDNTAADIVNSIVNGTDAANSKPMDGQIYLLHDQPSINTVHALPEAVHLLRLQGFGFLTLSELREHRKITLTPGVTYYRF